MDRISILVKYGELTLKKKNAKTFKSILKQNIEGVLVNYDVNVVMSFSRLYIELNQKDLDDVAQLLQKVYGISSFAVYVACENNLEVIKTTCLNYIKNLSINTLRVDTKRKNKSFEITSMEVSRIIGGYIRANSSFEVDLHNPDLRLKIEIRNSETLIYFNEYRGLGGLPVSSSGKALLLLSGGIDSPVAGNLINKRGVRFDAIHFASPPYTSKEALTKVQDLCDVLVDYNGPFNLYVVNFTKPMEELLKIRKISYYMVIMRRLMYLIANNIARQNGQSILVNGDAIGQVASQTLESIHAIDVVSELSIIRPLATFDKLEVISLSKNIGTFDISIRDFEDCCTIFIPDNPIIRPKIDECIKIEKELNLDELISIAMSNVEVLKVSKSINKFEELL